ncbi:hypothetical protein [Rhabdochlamydiaceae symbiont of Dictyostelium giganteum]|uniref:hypothetical protein n=1 Tax=Rhabdochlamydiaceae symbiont of Dictyostelium giganteum TaxID=3342349 RepID=UPI00384BD8B5
MTNSNIQSLRDLLPPQATKTLSYLNEAVNQTGNSRLTRCKYTVYAITSSSVNGFLYLIPITAQVFLSKRFVTAILNIDFTEIKHDAFQCFKHAFNSFHFAAALTAFVVLSCFRSEMPQNPHQPLSQTENLLGHLPSSQQSSLPPEIPPVNPPSHFIPHEPQEPSSHQNPHLNPNVLAQANSTHASTFSLISPAATEEISNSLEPGGISSEEESSLPSSPSLKKQPLMESNASTIARYVNPFPINGDLDEEEQQDALPSSPLEEQHPAVSNLSESIHEDDVNNVMTFSVGPDSFDPNTFSVSLSQEGNREVSSTLLKQIESPVSMKEQKFYDYFDQLKQFLLSDSMKRDVAYIKQYANSPSSYNLNRLTDVCASLIDLINQDSSDKAYQYKTFVIMLRKGKKMCGSLQEFHNETSFIRKLSYYRFTGMHVYNYCQKLVEKVSGGFEEELSLANFWDTLQKRNASIKNLPIEENISSLLRGFQKLKGFLNVGFDPLCTGENVPYVYGYLQKNTRPIAILRHGVAVSHSDVTGIVANLRASTSSGYGLEMNPDYIAFIEEAHSYNKNILHIVLENTEFKKIGDESARTDARLSLGHHPNFYPLALRLDGEFFKATPSQDEDAGIVPFQERLLEEIFSPTSGFKIPEKILVTQGSLSTFKTKIKECIDNVKTTYFPEKTHFISPEQRKAFILLSYVRITHLLLEDLDISILEAHCKDDIDRGGAFKAALILDHHYRMGTLSSKTLQEVMVSIIAAPLIVKKQPIIESRAVLIKAVLDIMQTLSPQLLNTVDTFQVAVE